MCESLLSSLLGNLLILVEYLLLTLTTGKKRVQRLFVLCIGGIWFPHNSALGISRVQLKCVSWEGRNRSGLTNEAFRVVSACTYREVKQEAGTIRPPFPRFIVIVYVIVIVIVYLSKIYMNIFCTVYI